MLKRFWYKTWPKLAVTLCGVALYLAAIGVDKETSPMSSSWTGRYWMTRMKTVC